MPKKNKKTVEKSKNKENLLPFGVLYEVPDMVFSKYVDQSALKKLGEKLGKEIILYSLGFAFPETHSNVLLIGSPKMEKKTVMIASDKSIGEEFYAALKAIDGKVP